MSSLYVTTCRHPTPGTRRLVKWLAALLGAKTENRGKRSFDELLSRAEAFGCKRLLFVYESHGNPSELRFYEGEWLGVVPIKSVGMPTEKPRQYSGVEVEASDEYGKKLAGLFDLPEPEVAGVKLVLGGCEAAFFHGSNKLLSFKLA